MDDATLYPDVVEHEGLTPALADAARRISVDIGPLANRAAPNRYWTAKVPTDRDSVNVGMGAEERWFSISIGEDGRRRVSGGTPDLSEVARVAAMWRGGATRRELVARFPFLSWSRLAQAYEEGGPVETMWEDLLGDPKYHDVHPMLQAARANERLGRLFPLVSMYTDVRFEIDHTDRSAGQIIIRPTSDGYDVIPTWASDSRRAVTGIDEAISAAEAMLPATAF